MIGCFSPFSRIDELLGAARARVDKFAQDLRLSSFSAVDFREHIRAGVEAGAGIIAYPPTYRGGYEQQYRFLHASVEWSAPSYAVFDPADIGSVLDQLDEARSPWCILTDRQIHDRAPILEFTPGRQRTIYGYGRGARPSYGWTPASRAAPFRYKPLDLTALTATSGVELVPIDGPAAAYIKDVYLAKNIVHVGGMANIAVLLDGMLAGLLVYTLSEYGVYSPREIYLLSDLSVSREGKLSKLIARLALSRAIIAHLETKFVRIFDLVVTTAFSKHPVSMKYRGLFDLLKRTEADGGYILNYGKAPIDETPADAYAWWWSKHGKTAGGGRAADRNRGAERRSKIPATA